jgi:hypothetical protein
MARGLTGAGQLARVSRVADGDGFDVHPPAERASGVVSQHSTTARAEANPLSVMGD